MKTLLAKSNLSKPNKSVKTLGMVFAELIMPHSVKKWQERGYVSSGDRIACESCGLDYSFDSYGVLYKSKKLAYFLWADPDSIYSPLLCHGCLFRWVREIAEGEEIILVIYDEKKEYICRFYPETGNLDFPMDHGFDKDNKSDWEDPDDPPFLPE